MKLDGTKIHQGTWIDEQRFVALIVDKEEIDQYTKGLSQEQKESVYERVAHKMTDCVLDSCNYDEIIQELVRDQVENISKSDKEKFECDVCSCYFWVEDRNNFECPNCEAKKK